MEQKIIEAFNTEKGVFPWRVRIDGRPDPRNRDFESFSDVRETFAALQEEGYYKGYKIVKS